MRSRKSSTYWVPPGISFTPEQFHSFVFGIHQNEHVKAFYIHRRAAMFHAASDSMAAGIARAGSVSAWLASQQVQS